MATAKKKVAILRKRHGNWMLLRYGRSRSHGMRAVVKNREKTPPIKKNQSAFIFLRKKMSDTQRMTTEIPIVKRDIKKGSFASIWDQEWWKARSCAVISSKNGSQKKQVVRATVPTA